MRVANGLGMGGDLRKHIQSLSTFIVLLSSVSSFVPDSFSLFRVHHESVYTVAASASSSLPALSPAVSE